VIAVAAVLLGLWLRPRAIPVEAVTVSRGELVVALEEEGVTRIHPRTVVAAPAAGRFFPLPLREGDRLAAGQPMGWLVPAPLDSRSRAQAEAALGAARAALAEARAQVAEALVARDHSRRERERQEALGRAGHQAPSLVDDARAAELAAARAHEAAVARAAAAAQHVESARAVLVTGEGAPPGSASWHRILRARLPAGRTSCSAASRNRSGWWPRERPSSSSAAWRTSRWSWTS
jgi:HlyD family secretion protein